MNCDKKSKKREQTFKNNYFNLTITKNKNYKKRIKSENNSFKI